MTGLKTCVAAFGFAALVVPAAAQTPQKRTPLPPNQPAVARDAPPAPAGTAAIDGVLTAVGTGRPVRRARVTLTGGDPRIVRTTTTDDRGVFAFGELPAGLFLIAATRPGFLESMYGQKRPGSARPGTPIQLAAGQHLEHLALQIPRGGVITGTILDELGDPAFGVTVRALRYVMRSGERTLQPAGTAQSDDRGVYRITGLFPGEYVISAASRDADVLDVKMQMEMVAVEKIKAVTAAGAELGDLQGMLDQVRASGSDPAKEPVSGYATIYYPGSTIGSGASVVRLDIGEEKPGIDLQLQVVPLSRISGVVTSPDIAIPASAQVLLFDANDVAGSTPRSTRPGPDGRFSFSAVPQGQYTLVARSGGAVVAVTPAAGGAGAMKINATAPSNQYWALAEVSADGRSGGPVTLTLQPGMAVSGRLVFDGATPTDVTRVRLSLSPVGQGIIADLASGTRPAGIDAEGRFTFVGVVPGRYRVALAGGLTGWSLKSAIVAGQDVLDVPLEVKPGENINGAVVTTTMRSTDLSGMLQGPVGEPTAEYTIVVFASDGRYWLPQSRRIQATRPSTSGRFSFRDLPPGDYRLAAVSDVEPGQWFDPAFLRQLVGASIAVTLGDGERKTQDLRVAR